MSAAFQRVVAELNLDTSDLFTKVLAAAFALQDERDELRAAAERWRLAYESVVRLEQQTKKAPGG